MNIIYINVYSWVTIEQELMGNNKTLTLPLTVVSRSGNIRRSQQIIVKSSKQGKGKSPGKVLADFPPEMLLIGAVSTESDMCYYCIVLYPCLKYKEGVIVQLQYRRCP